MQPFESVATIVTGKKVPVTVGVPERMPSVDRVMPAGRPVLWCQRIGGTPPDCVNWTGPYRWLARPSGIVPGLTVIVAQLTTMT